MAAERVLIIGGGLAGLAAAVALAPRGCKVTLVESRSRLGGRASSFQDAATGQLIDACQHVSMGCCTNLAHFCKAIGIDRYLEPQPTLYFMTPDRRVSTFGTGWLPAPLHLSGSFLRAHYLTLGEKLHVAYGLACLRLRRGDDDPPFQEWLLAHGQTQRIIDRFWGLVLVSALNELPENVGIRYARKVFVDGFLKHRKGFEVEVPKVPLGKLYGEELLDWFTKHDVEVRIGKGIKSLDIVQGRVMRAVTREGESIEGDTYVSTVPFDRLLDLLPAEVVEANQSFRILHNLQVSPITSVHLWLDRAITDLPHVVLIDSIGQWVFCRGVNDRGEHYVQVVVSAARQFRGLGHDEVERRIVAELTGLFPKMQDAKLLRSRVVTEHQATFSAVPGVDRFRPLQKTPISNLFLAGDWTATGWPATMEGAVRSGYLAAEQVLAHSGRTERLLQPDLGG